MKVMPVRNLNRNLFDRKEIKRMYALQRSTDVFGTLVDRKVTPTNNK